MTGAAAGARAEVEVMVEVAVGTADSSTVAGSGSHGSGAWLKNACAARYLARYRANIEYRPTARKENYLLFQPHPG